MVTPFLGKAFSISYTVTPFYQSMNMDNGYKKELTWGIMDKEG